MSEDLTEDEIQLVIGAIPLQVLPGSLSTSDGPLDCPQCNAAKAFFVDPGDPAVGFCLAEQASWRIYDLRCATVGCLREKATFGDFCMLCLKTKVNTEI